MKKPVIAIDGPAGAGKSSVSREVADRLGFLYIDTGAMYRAFALKCTRNGIPPDDMESISKTLEKTTIDLKHDAQIIRVFLDCEDVTEQIRTREAGTAASIFSRLPVVRRKMIEIQRQLGQKGEVVMEGRDIGTVVLPDADLKIFLDASSEIRAIRRYKELKGRNVEPDLKSNEFTVLLAEQIKRDKADRERTDSPLKPSDDAIIIDTSSMTRSKVVEKIITLYEKKLKTHKNI